MMFKETVCVALFCAVLTEGIWFDVTGWTYSDQDAWDESCFGDNQSPIDIISGDAAEINPKFFNFINYQTTSNSVTLLNIYTTASIIWGEPTPLLSGADLPGTYVLFFTQFHWGGPSDNKGSEHLVDGHQSALELQLYHWNKAYGNVDTAFSTSDGIAVLSILYDVGPANDALEPLISKLPNILDAGSSLVVTDGSIPALSSLLPPDTSKFYRYNGSKTFPLCFESVIWTVFAERQTVSIAQLDEFRQLNDQTGSNIISNFRLVQNSPAIMVTYSDGQ